MTHNAQPIDPDVIVVGIDTHKDVHVGVALDHLGRPLGQQSAPTSPAGLRTLLSWAQRVGGRRLWGVEGTGSYGAR